MAATPPVKGRKGRSPVKGLRGVGLVEVGDSRLQASRVGFSWKASRGLWKVQSVAVCTTGPIHW